jgi:cytochrome c oxidase subunit III
MPGTIVDEIEVINAGGGGGTDVPAGGDDDAGGSDGALGGVPRRAYFTAIQLGMAGIVMFFMALTSSFLVRKGLGNDWVPFVFPRILWFNTAVLLASSLTIHIARKHLHQNEAREFSRWWAVTTGLGILFLGGQLLGWRQLAAQGVFLVTNPSSSFFYLLTALHGLHLLGGVVALFYVSLRNWERSRITQATAGDLVSIYWHFMGGLWIFLFALLYLGR